jgi:hypothetical protein
LLPDVAVRGRVEPRVWTPPLRDLSDPDASWGYDFIDFCTAIGWPLDEWQQWLAIHLGELLPDGSPRYRKAIILVARQNGKTVFCRLLILYWMFVERVPEILATSTDRAAAKRSWRKVVEMAEGVELLADRLPARHTALQIGEEDFWNDHGAHYRFAAPTRRAGRGDTLHRALLDELREHRTRDTWDAVEPAMGAVHDALLVCISNEGDEESVVLHEEYDAAETYARTGQGDSATFLAAWSSPSDSDPEDLEALAYANPSLGGRMPAAALLGAAAVAKRSGGETLARFKVERMCMRVGHLDPAIDPDSWKACGAPGAELPKFAEHRGMLALVFDISIDATHATVSAAATIDGITTTKTLRSWDGFGCVAEMRRDLPGIVTELRPRVVGWFPGGPAAAVAPAVSKRGFPRGTRLEELRAEDVAAACMGAADVVVARELRYAHEDALLTAHVGQAVKLKQGDRWRFDRQGKDPIDAAYAMAGAVHLARSLRPRPSAVPDAD